MSEINSEAQVTQPVAETPSSDAGFDKEAALREISSGLGFGPEESDLDPEDPDAEVSQNPQAKTEETPSEASQETTTSAAETSPAAEVPKTWRSEAAAVWSQIPPLAQAEILKREQDIFSGLAQYKEAADFGRSVAQSLQPYEHLFQRFNIPPMQAVGQLLQMQRLLVEGSPQDKAALVQRVMQQHNIQLPSAEDGGTQPYIDPQVSNLRAELDQIKSTQRAEAEARDRSVRESLRRELDAFAADPSHPHFNEVANDIAALLQTKSVKDLKEAYEKAVWMNPVTRAKETARLAAEAEAKAKAEAKLHAQRAQKANSARLPVHQNSSRGTAAVGTMDDTLLATLREIKGRS